MDLDPGEGGCQTAGVAKTLLGAMFFLMSMTYLTNHGDKDIRRYTYEVISQTISIFCAVLIFQSTNDFVDEAIRFADAENFKVCISLVHMVIWYAALQFHVYRVSLFGLESILEHKHKRPVMHGALENAVTCASLWRSMGLNDKGGKEADDHVEDLQAQMTCWKVLLSHISGFAAVNAFGNLQQTDFCKRSWPHSIFVVPVAVLGLWVLQHFCHWLRMRSEEYWRMMISLQEPGITAELFEEVVTVWEEEVEECEDDVFGLATSFLLIQSIRFSISGSLPNLEGIDSWSTMTERSSAEIWSLAVTGLIFAALTVFFDTWGGRHVSHEEEGQEEPRLLLKLMTMTTMAFAWCGYFGYKWFLASTFFSPSTVDRMTLLLDLATGVSLVSFIVIWVLDKLADLDTTDEEADHAIIQVIGGNAILIGFAWEQAFDRALEVIATDSTMPTFFVKVILAASCVGVIVPAWRRWILPMVLREGWRFGFVLDPWEDKWSKLFKHRRWKRVLERHEVKQTLTDNLMLKKKRVGHSHQKRRKEKGLAAALERANTLLLEDGHAIQAEAMSPKREVQTECLLEPLLSSDPELAHITKTITSLTRQLHVIAEHKKGTAHRMQQMSIVSGQIGDLATLAANLGCLSLQPTRSVGLKGSFSSEGGENGSRKL